MTPRVLRVVLATAGAVAVAVCLTSRVVVAGESEYSAVVLTTHRAIQASLNRIATESVSWRRAIAALAGTGRHIVVVTPDDVVVARPDDPRHRRPFDRSVLAEVARVAPDPLDVRSVLVVVNVDLLDTWHQSRRSVRHEFEMDLDAVLVHEVYGHAVPYLQAGTEAGHCPDPTAGQRAEEACSIQRENVIRAEIGLAPRRAYDLGDLQLARR